MKTFVSKNKDNLITYGIVVVAYAVMEILIKAGLISSLMQGLLVPLCAYVILAVSLNLTVGILGELSLGHAGFMCVGAFTSAFFSKITMNVITVTWIRFTLAIVIGFIAAGLIGFLIGMPVRFPHRNSGSSLKGRLSCDSYACFRRDHQKRDKRSLYRKRFKGTPLLDEGCRSFKS